MCSRWWVTIEQMPLNIYLSLRSGREHTETCDHSDTDSKTAIDQAMLRPHDFTDPTVQRELCSTSHNQNTQWQAQMQRK